MITQKCKQILNTSYDGIYVTDSSGRALYVNEAYFQITGLKQDDVFDKTLEELISGGYIKSSVAKRVLQSKEVTTIVQEIGSKQVIITGTPLLDENGEVVLIVINIRDISELNFLREKYEAAHRLSEQYYSELAELRLQQLDMRQIVAKSKKMHDLIQLAMRVSRVDSTVLIKGESGVGKGVFAEMIHNAGLRSAKPFIHINCASIPENLMEAEFFGYEKGAFTGAKDQGKTGLFEIAHEGTIFLDEIGDLPLILQPKLLQVLETGELRPIGGVNSIFVDVRVISASNKNLEEMVNQKKFREDLYYRLKVIEIEIPPLRDRKEDIPALINNYLQRFNARYGSDKQLSLEAIHRLAAYPWRGNIRELENLIENLYVMSDSKFITLPDLPDYIVSPQQGQTPADEHFSPLDMKEAVVKIEKQMINDAFKKCKNTREAARLLGVSQPTLVRKMKRYGLQGL